MKLLVGSAVLPVLATGPPRAIVSGSDSTPSMVVVIHPLSPRRIRFILALWHTCSWTR